jgi:hypothetical protein
LTAYNNGVTGECDYCGAENICIDAEDLIGEIINGITFEYEEAVECMGYEDGEYVGADTWDTYDLLHDFGIEMELADNLFDDVLETVNDTIWCQRDPYNLAEGKEKAWMWKAFCKMVKEETRYVFFRMQPKHEFEDETSHTILDYIGQKATSFELVIDILEGKRFVRGQIHNNTEILSTGKRLGSPPFNKAKANRMSAEGISIFYGAEDVDTVIAEILDMECSHITIANFTNLRPLKILDLTKIPSIRFPSLFDKDRREDRQALSFYRELCKDLMRPIETMENVEYIPAQIVAEYFRFLYEYKGQKIDGIKYSSAKKMVEFALRYFLIMNNATSLKTICIQVKTKS